MNGYYEDICQKGKKNYNLNINDMEFGIKNVPWRMKKIEGIKLKVDKGRTQINKTM